MQFPGRVRRASVRRRTRIRLGAASPRVESPSLSGELPPAQVAAPGASAASSPRGAEPLALVLSGGGDPTIPPRGLADTEPL